MKNLNTLPNEILFNILSFALPFNPILVPNHPLYALAATSRHLCSVVEEYTRVLLKKHAAFTVPKKSEIFVCRKKWIKWLGNTCQLCKKKSVRKAILDPSLTCCMACDKNFFPKMSMNAAVTTHGITKLDLFTPNALHPHLPPLTVGEYVCNGVDTTMISEPDVLARKEFIHGMLTDSTPKALRRRNTTHTLLLKHMNPTIPAGYSKWVLVRGDDIREYVAWKSLRTPESRAQFVKETLESEWAAMGVDQYSLDPTSKSD